MQVLVPEDLTDGRCPRADQEFAAARAAFLAQARNSAVRQAAGKVPAAERFRLQRPEEFAQRVGRRDAGDEVPRHQRAVPRRNTR